MIYLIFLRRPSTSPRNSSLTNLFPSGRNVLVVATARKMHWTVEFSFPGSQIISSRILLSRSISSIICLSMAVSLLSSATELRILYDFGKAAFSPFTFRRRWMISSRVYSVIAQFFSKRVFCSQFALEDAIISIFFGKSDDGVKREVLKQKSNP